MEKDLLNHSLKIDKLASDALKKKESRQKSRNLSPDQLKASMANAFKT